MRVQELSLYTLADYSQESLERSEPPLSALRKLTERGKQRFKLPIFLNQAHVKGKITSFSTE